MNAHLHVCVYMNMCDPLAAVVEDLLALSAVECTYIYE